MDGIAVLVIEESGDSVRIGGAFGRCGRARRAQRAARADKVKRLVGQAGAILDDGSGRKSTGVAVAAPLAYWICSAKLPYTSRFMTTNGMMAVASPRFDSARRWQSAGPMYRSSYR